MTDEREDALNELLRAYDERLAAGPVVDRRAQVERRGAQEPSLIEASRASGPVHGDFVYWISIDGVAGAAR